MNKKRELDDLYDVINEVCKKKIEDITVFISDNFAIETLGKMLSDDLLRSFHKRINHFLLKSQLYSSDGCEIITINHKNKKKNFSAKIFNPKEDQKFDLIIAGQYDKSDWIRSDKNLIYKGQISLEKKILRVLENVFTYEDENLNDEGAFYQDEDFLIRQELNHFSVSDFKNHFFDVNQLEEVYQKLKDNKVILLSGFSIGTDFLAKKFQRRLIEENQRPRKTGMRARFLNKANALQFSKDVIETEAKIVNQVIVFRDFFDEKIAVNKIEMDSLHVESKVNLPQLEYLSDLKIDMETYFEDFYTHFLSKYAEENDAYLIFTSQSDTDKDLINRIKKKKQTLGKDEYEGITYFDVADKLRDEKVFIKDISPNTNPLHALSSLYRFDGFNEEGESVIYEIGKQKFDFDDYFKRSRINNKFRVSVWINIINYLYAHHKLKGKIWGKDEIDQEISSYLEQYNEIYSGINEN